MVVVTGQRPADRSLADTKHVGHLPWWCSPCCVPFHPVNALRGHHGFSASVSRLTTGQGFTMVWIDAYRVAAEGIQLLAFRWRLPVGLFPVVAGDRCGGHPGADHRDSMVVGASRPDPAAHRCGFSSVLVSCGFPVGHENERTAGLPTNPDFDHGQDTSGDHDPGDILIHHFERLVVRAIGSRAKRSASSENRGRRGPFGAALRPEKERRGDGRQIAISAPERRRDSGWRHRLPRRRADPPRKPRSPRLSP